MNHRVEIVEKDGQVRVVGAPEIAWFSLAFLQRSDPEWVDIYGDLLILGRDVAYQAVGFEDEHLVARLVVDWREETDGEE